MIMLFNRLLNYLRIQSRQSCTASAPIVFGIETSCDDTGGAIVDGNGRVLAESIQSQTKIHVQSGGIHPLVAANLHKQHIERVVDDVMDKSGISVCSIDAIAVTTHPGLSLSLAVGLEYAKKLNKKWNKPVIPIHHMRAHALTIRMTHSVSFPFLVLLISGGHCILTVAKSVNEFVIVGESIDDAPGEAFDKIARELDLKSRSDCENMSGGKAIETVAKLGNATAYRLPEPMAKYRDCNFSFSGLKSNTKKLIWKHVNQYGHHRFVPDICASFQLALTKHICRKTQRAMLFAECKGYLPSSEKHLVVSGGVACNGYVKKCLQSLCNKLNYTLHVPPPEACTDNGVMIAWNGVEAWLTGDRGVQDAAELQIKPKSPIGTSVIQEVQRAHMKIKWADLPL